MIRTIYSFLAFRGYPNWFGNFYIIDVSKNKIFMSAIAKGDFNKAEATIRDNKFMADFVSLGVIPADQCLNFSGYDSAEYMRCVSAAYFEYLHEYYLMHSMRCFSEDLIAKKWWKEPVYCIPEKLNELAIVWNNNFYNLSGTEGSEFSDELKKVIAACQQPLTKFDISRLMFSTWTKSFNHFDILRLMFSTWTKSFKHFEAEDKISKQSFFAAIKKLNTSYLAAGFEKVETFISYMALGLSYYKHLKRVKYHNVLLV